jgi:hypothetical protein
MDKRTIVRDTLDRKQREVVPHNIDFTRDMREKLRKHLGLERPEDIG